MARIKRKKKSNFQRNMSDILHVALEDSRWLSWLHVGALGLTLVLLAQTYEAFLPSLACKEKYRRPYSRKGRIISKNNLNVIS